MFETYLAEFNYCFHNLCDTFVWWTSNGKINFEAKEIHRETHNALLSFVKANKRKLIKKNTEIIIGGEFLEKYELSSLL